MNLQLLKDFIIGVIYLLFGLIFISKLLKEDNKKRVNLYFSIIIFLLYLFGVIISAFREYQYNLQMVTPLSNVSPMLFTLTFVSIFLPDKLKNRVYKFMCNFNFVMIIAGFVSIIYSLIICVGFFKFIIFDELAHITYGLFVIYLLKSGQITLSKKDFAINCIAMSLVLIFVFLMNLIFNWHLFGVCLTEDYNIYGNKIFDNCHISNIVYICALSVVMISSYFLTKIYKNKQ